MSDNFKYDASQHPQVQKDHYGNIIPTPANPRQFRFKSATVSGATLGIVSAWKDPVFWEKDDIWGLPARQVEAVFELRVMDGVNPGDRFSYAPNGRIFVVNEIRKDMASELTTIRGIDPQAHQRAITNNTSGTPMTKPLPGERPGVELPLHDPEAMLKKGDKIVILAGEQKGYRGVAIQDEVEAGKRLSAIWVQLTRPDGSKMQQNIHKREFVALVLTAANVPKFERVEDAEAWLAINDRKPRQFHPTGSQVRFTAPAELLRKLTGFGPGKRSKVDGKPWENRYDDFETTGRIIKFMPWWEGAVPGYEVLTMVQGEPEIVEVAAHRIIGPA